MHVCAHVIACTCVCVCVCACVRACVRACVCLTRTASAFHMFRMLPHAYRTPPSTAHMQQVVAAEVVPEQVLLVHHGTAHGMCHLHVRALAGLQVVVVVVVDAHRTARHGYGQMHLSSSCRLQHKAVAAAVVVARVA